MPKIIRSALLAATLAASVARAEPFTLFVYEAPEVLALRTDEGPAGADYRGAYAPFAEAATAAGVLQGGAPLSTDADAIVTVVAGGVDAQPFAVSGPALGGYFQIDVADLAAAQDWAARLPAAETGAVEVRAGYPAPAM